MDEPRPQVFPTYVVIDESQSMLGTEEQLQAVLTALLDAPQDDPDWAAVAHVGVVGFSDAAYVRQPLTDWAELAEVPELQLGGMTSYRAAFELLRDVIEDDVEALKASNYRVLRPAVFFFSAGKPDHQDWESAHKALVSPDFPYHPNVLAFGVGDPDARVIARVATRERYAFMADEGASVGAIFLNVIHTLWPSGGVTSGPGPGVVASGGAVFLQLAESEGFITIGIDDL